MGGAVRKQYMDLGGKPVLARTLHVFDTCPDIARIVLAAPAGDLPYIESVLLPGTPLEKELRLTAGGSTRQDSVFNGLLAAKDADWVAVHDGVRPFVTAAEISACVQTARECGAAMLASPVHETVWRADAEGFVVEGVDRSGLWLAQTPQVFERGLLVRAHLRAREEGCQGTDDAGLVLRLGHPVRVAPGGRNNVKITTPADLEWARGMLEAGGKEY